MALLFWEIFVNASIIAVTAMIIGVVLFAYRSGKFLSGFAWGTLTYMIIFVVVFLSYRYGSGHITKEVASEPFYVFLATFHSIVSLWAIVQVTIMFFLAQKACRAGKNFFKERAVWTAVLVLAWTVSLTSGFFL